MKLNYFNFKEFNDKFLLTNDFGKYLFLTKDEFQKLLAKDIKEESELGNKLIQAKIIYNENDLDYSDSSKHELRRIKNHVNSATALHIFVVTTNCNLKCIYCQANNGKSNSHLVLDENVAKKAIDIALSSPQHSLTFEFQGGEPLANYDIIKKMVVYAEENKGNHIVEYNIVTNLTLLNNEMIEFFKRYKFGISTSIDGFEELHNHNRPFVDGIGTYKVVKDALNILRNEGFHVGAIETTTRSSLKYAKELVRSYSELGFDSIFIRPLTPLGRADVNWDEIGYTADEFISFYIEAMDEIMKINGEGKFLKEAHAYILLRRIFGHAMNYMELRSPCGAGIGQLAYYPDGNIFTCDEGRMLFEMGDDAFCLGNVHENSFSELVGGSVCKAVCASSILESIPSCCDCVYQPYCGTCPVINYSSSKDIIEKQPRGYRCKIYSGILDYLFTLLLRYNEDEINVLNSWIH